MKTKRVIRLRSNSMPEQVWKSFAFMKLCSLAVLLVFAPVVLSAQSHDHPDNPKHFAEDLWASIDQNAFRDEYVRRAGVPKSEIPLFLKYIRYKFQEDKMEFFSKAEAGVINRENLEAYLEEKKQLYASQYENFIQEKDQFLRELSEADEANQVLAANGPCTNIDFETGTRNGWQGFTADACTNPNLCSRSNGFSSSRHLITNTGMTDPFIPGLSPVAPGGNHSLRLENTQNGGDAAGISQTFLVTSTNNVFTYQYAVVLEDPGDHTDAERPYFKVRMYDEGNNEITCATYTAIAKPPIENFTLVEVGNKDFYYRNWTTVSIPLLDYIGQNVRIEFVVSDCSRGGHLAYAYIDGQCSMLDPVTPKYICQNQNVTITATPGFAGYAWSGPGIVGPADQQSVVVNMPGDYSITFTPISDNPCPVTVDFTVQEHCNPDPIADAFCEEEKEGGEVTGINLNDYAADILGYHSSPGMITSWHDGFPATSANLISPAGLTVSDGSSYYAVISYSNLGILGGDTARIDFTVHPLPNVTFPDIADVCQGSPPFQITASPSGGIFSGTGVTAGGVFNPAAAGLFPVKYTYTDANGCIDTLSKPVTVKIPPTVEAGLPQSLCAGVASISLSGSYTHATGVVWSGGSGTFSPNPTDPEAVYIPTAAERNSGEVSLTLTTTGTAPCTPVSDAVTVTLIAGPIVDAGEDQTLCETSAVFDLNAVVTNGNGGTWSGGNGSFSPDAEAPDAVYSPSPSEIIVGSVLLTYTVNGNAPCSSVSDHVILTIVAAPTADAGLPQTLCADITTLNLSGSTTNTSGVSWSGGAGTFSPSNADVAVYTPSASEKNSGSVTLTLTASGNAPCASVSGDVTISFVQPPVIDAGPEQSLCSDNAEFTLAGTSSNGGVLSWTGGGGSFSPNASDGNAVYTPSVSEINAGTVTLTYTASGNAPCSPVSDHVVLAIVAAPTADAGLPQTLCADITTLNLSGSSANTGGVSWSGGAGTFAPSNTDITVYTPSASEKNSGSVTLTLTASGNAPCASVSGDVTISFVQPPVIDAGPEQSLCSDNAEFTLAGTSSNGGVLSWTGGGGSFSPNASDGNAVYTPSASEINAGTVTLTYTASGNAPCSPVSDHVVLTIVAAPTADAGLPQTLCADITTLNLSGDATNASGVSWSGGAGTFSPSNADVVVYTPSASEKNSGSVTLTLTAAGDTPCVSVSDDVTISFVQPPAVNAGPDQTLCASEAIFDLNGTASNKAGVNWSGGGGFYSSGVASEVTSYTPSVSEINAGTVTLTLTATGNAPCADISDQVVLTIGPMPTPHAGPDQTVCQGSSMIVSTSWIDGESYEWKNIQGSVLGNGNSITITANTDTTLIVVATSPLGCIFRDTMQIDAVPYPIVLVKDTSMCPGEKVELKGVVPNMADLMNYPVSSEWKSGGKTLADNQSSYTASAGGVYTFSVTAHSCTSGDDATVSVNPVPVSNMPELVKFCPELDGQTSLHAPAGYSYSWFPGGNTSQDIQVQTPGIYTVTLTNEFDCSVQDQAEVAEACPPRLFVGNAFSPDGDDVNDLYTVHSAHIGRFHMLVFNRWGEVIFESSDHTYFWDGYYRGEPMPIGVYPWIITYEGDTEDYKGPYKQEGSVTIVR